MSKCTVCRAAIEIEEPAILYVNGAGAAKEVCPDCEALLNIVAEGLDTNEIKEALDTLRLHLQRSRDIRAMAVINELLKDNPAARRYAPDDDAL